MKNKITILLFCLFSSALYANEIENQCWVDIAYKQVFIFQNDSLEIKNFDTNFSRKSTYRIVNGNVYLLDKGAVFDSLQVRHLDAKSLELFYFRDNIIFDFISYDQKDIQNFTDRFNHHNFSLTLESDDKKELLFKYIEYDSVLTNFIRGSRNCITNHFEKVMPECYGTILRIEFESAFKSDTLKILIDSIGTNYVTGVDYNSKKYVKLTVAQEESSPRIIRANYIFDSLDLDKFAGNYIIKIEEYSNENDKITSDEKNEDANNENSTQKDFTIYIGHSYFTFFRDKSFIGEFKKYGAENGEFSGEWDLRRLRDDIILKIRFTDETEFGYLKVKEISKNEFWLYSFYITNCYDDISNEMIGERSKCMKLIKTNPD